MHGSVEQRVVVGFALMGVLLAAGFGIASFNMRALLDAGTQVTHTQSVLAALAITEGALSDAQTGARGFVLTGEEADLVPYRAARTALPPQLDHLRTLLADNPAQLARLAVLTPQVDRALGVFQQMIDARRLASIAATQELVWEGRGESALIASQQIIADLETAEEQLLVQHTATVQADAISTGRAFAVLTLLGFVLLGAVFLLIRRARREHAHGEAALRQQQDLYQLLVQAQSDLGVGVLIGGGGRILYANDAVVAITGYSLAELRAMGSPVDLIAADEYPSYLDHARRRARGEAVPGLLEIEILHKGGQRIPVQSALQHIMFEGQPAQLAMVQDITARKKAAEALNYERDLLDALMNNIPDSIYFKDCASRFIRINTALADQLGLTEPAQAVGKTDFDYFTVEHARPAFDDEQEILRTSQPLMNREEQEIWGEGRTRWVLTTKMPLRDPTGALIGTFGVSRDITERKKHERMKTEFISTVSHELRTPLTSIRGSLGLIAGGVAGAISPQVQALVDIASSNSERLMRLINDLLDIDKIESGQVVFDRQPQALMPLVEAAVAANQGYAAHLGVHYVLTQAVPSGQVNVDADRLIQVITNLLSNAAKFSPVGAAVDLAVTRTGTLLRVAVTDQGPGIPDEFRSRIFQKFAQADSSDTRQKGGTGLGLSIAKAIVERHGGEIGFSTSGPTTFYFTLPAQGESRQPAA